MKKTFITTMPDKAGAFLYASQIIALHNCNIVRVSYNKSVDIHTMFIDAEGEERALSNIACELESNGYIFNEKSDAKVMLIIFKLIDQPGSVTPILELLKNLNINITYINSQENGTEFQHFKMGLLIDDASIVKTMLDEISKLCEITVLDYNPTEKVLDNTVFYISFANEIRKMLNLSQDNTNKLIANANQIMQMLDEKGEKPYKTFEFISKFADFVAKYKGENFSFIHKEIPLTLTTKLHILIPPIGCNCYVLEGEERLLFIDIGFACFADEIMREIMQYFPNFLMMNKEIIITHVDIDHTGAINIFDNIYLNAKSFDNFVLENSGKDNYREQNNKNSPYCKISKIISNYTPPDMAKATIIDTMPSDNNQPLSKIGMIKFEDLTFDIMQGYGGHVDGEIVLICSEIPLIFTGDNLVNIKGFSQSQAEFNTLAPYLMTSVNINSVKAQLIRMEIEKIASSRDKTIICPAHGDWIV